MFYFGTFLQIVKNWVTTVNVCKSYDYFNLRWSLVLMFFSHKCQKDESGRVLNLTSGYKKTLVMKPGLIRVKWSVYSKKRKKATMIKMKRTCS